MHGESGDQRGEQHSDQAHVVEERKPRDADVGRAKPQGRCHRGGRGDRRALRDDRAARIPGRARGELEKRRSRGGRARTLEAVRLKGRGHRRNTPACAGGRRQRRQHVEPRPLEDRAKRPHQQLGALIQHRPRKRHRRRAQRLRCEEGRDEVGPVGKQDAHPAAGLKGSGLAERRGPALRACQHRAAAEHHAFCPHMEDQPRGGAITLLERVPKGGRQAGRQERPAKLGRSGVAHHPAL